MNEGAYHRNLYFSDEHRASYALVFLDVNNIKMTLDSAVHLCGCKQSRMTGIRINDHIEQRRNHHRLHKRRIVELNHSLDPVTVLQIGCSR